MKSTKSFVKPDVCSMKHFTIHIRNWCWFTWTSIGFPGHLFQQFIIWTIRHAYDIQKLKIHTSKPRWISSDFYLGWFICILSVWSCPRQDVHFIVAMMLLCGHVDTSCVFLTLGFYVDSTKLCVYCAKFSDYCFHDQLIFNMSDVC